MEENTVSNLYSVVISDKNMDIETKKILLDEIRKLKPPGENKWNFRSIVIVLGIIALIAPLTVLFHGYADTFPPGVLSLSSTAVGALAAFITSSLKK